MCVRDRERGRAIQLTFIIGAWRYACCCRRSGWWWWRRGRRRRCLKFNILRISKCHQRNANYKRYVKHFLLFLILLTKGCEGIKAIFYPLPLYSYLLFSILLSYINLIFPSLFFFLLYFVALLFTIIHDCQEKPEVNEDVNLTNQSIDSNQIDKIIFNDSN